MPTRQSWIDHRTILVEMLSPLTLRELNVCFSYLAEQIASSQQPVDILTKVSNTVHIPVDARIPAMQAGFVTDPRVNNLAVIGSSQWLKFLERIAVPKSSKPIYFYGSFAEAAYALGLADTGVM